MEKINRNLKNMQRMESKILNKLNELVKGYNEMIERIKILEASNEPN